MIGRIRGTLAGKQPPTVVIETAGGLGYELEVPMSTFYALPPLGEAVTLLTHQVVREDAHLLFGFASGEEREAFRELLRVSGVGPKVALAVLSGLTVAELSQCVAAQDVKRLTRIPGIGNKTAERLLLELRGKALGTARTGVIRGAGAPGTPAAATPADDVLHALVALGYAEREAVAACRDLPADVAVEEGIRTALKVLARK